MTVTTIGFDADDTLWQNESFFRLTQERFAALLADHAESDHLMDRLLAAERRNLAHYGFGIKAFTLSMIETAIEVTDGRVPASAIGEILAEGREMLRHPVHLLDGAEDAVRALAGSHTLVLITKGDLLDQERKLAESGLRDLFDGVEIVSDKTPATYARAFAAPDRAVMIGNSLKSDVLPAIEAGAHGIHVPHDLTWSYERAETPRDRHRFHHIDSLAALGGTLDTIGLPSRRA